MASKPAVPAVHDVLALHQLKALCTTALELAITSKTWLSSDAFVTAIQEYGDHAFGGALKIIDLAADLYQLPPEILQVATLNGLNMKSPPTFEKPETSKFMTKLCDLWAGDIFEIGSSAEIEVAINNFVKITTAIKNSEYDELYQM